MHRALSLLLPALLLPVLPCLPADVAAQVYTSKVADWVEAPLPPALARADRAVWSSAANYSRHNWRVRLEGGQVRASDGASGASASRAPADVPRGRAPGPTFEPRVRGHAAAAALAGVEDGWLVAYNEGEFGAALYWFSADGRQNYEISRNQVVRFFALRDGVYAIEGLAHLGLSQGSVLRITRAPGSPRWQAQTVAPLPQAPYAVAVRRDDSALIVLSDALVVLGRDRNLATLIEGAPWPLLYPNSALLTPDESKLYIGMRQYVAEVDMITKRLRLLIPSSQFLNRLPRPQEARVRAQAGG